MRSKNRIKHDKKENNKMNFTYKIILIILSCLLIISSSVLAYFCVKYTNLREINENVRNDISSIKEEILNVDNNFVTYTDELNSKKNELKDKIEEYNVWLEMIEKVK